MPTTLAHDRVAADTRGELTPANLLRSRDYIAGYVDTRDHRRNFHDCDHAAEYLAGEAAAHLRQHEPGFTISELDYVTDQYGRGSGPAAVVHRVGAPHEAVAAFHLRLDTGGSLVSLPDPMWVTEITRLGIAAVDARRRTERAADCWGTVAAIADDIEHVIGCANGEQMIENWVRITEEDGFDVTDDRRHIRRSLTTGDNIDRDSLEPWERFVIWDHGNCSLHVAHTHDYPDDPDDTVCIVATIDGQAAEHLNSVRAVADAAAATLHAELARHKPYGVSVIPVQYRWENWHAYLTCMTSEPNVAMLDGPMRPLPDASLGLVANPDHDPHMPHTRTIWADQLPAHTRPDPGCARSGASL